MSILAAKMESTEGDDIEEMWTRSREILTKTQKNELKEGKVG